MNESYKNFTVVGKQIRFGLAAVKNVGDAAIDVILGKERKEGSFNRSSIFAAGWTCGR